MLNPIPAKRISAYVERILVIDNYSINAPFALPLFANGTPTLLFLTTKAAINGNATNYLTLFGQTVFPEKLTIREDFTLIAYFFKPFALFSLFGVSAKELTDYPIDLDLLQRSQANELKEKMLNAGTTTAMMKLLDEYIFNLIESSKAEIQLIQFATSIIANNPSKESLLNVQKELCMTERTFERLFDKRVGISPSLFRRICQFNSAFQQLNSRRFGKLTDLAFENGYADQSHFIRAFREFTNITPKEYLNYGRQEPE